MKPVPTNTAPLGVTERALADVLLRRAHRALSGGKVELALETARQAVRACPDAGSFIAFGELLNLADRPSAALEAFATAAAMTMGQLPAAVRFTEGLIHARLGDADRAEAALRIAVALDPRRDGATFALASLLACRGAFDEADALFARDLRVRCDNGKFTWTRCIRLPLPGRPLGAEAPATPVPPGREIWFAAPAQPEGLRAVYAVAADSAYLCRFARPLAASLARSGGGGLLLHVHAINPDQEARSVLAELGRGPAAIGISEEAVDLSDWAEDARRSYYSCVRFLILPELLARHAVPVVVADIDQMLLADPAAVLARASEGDIGLLLFDNQRQNLLSRVSATLMLAAPTAGARRFAATLAAVLAEAIAEPQRMVWHLDQAALAVTQLGTEGVRCFCLDPAIVHLAADEPSPARPAGVGVFWSITHSIPANWAKLETPTFRALAGS
jgi:tetratricopeptide (TPR) repeat protein